MIIFVVSLKRVVEKQYPYLFMVASSARRVEHPIREVRINGEKTAQLGAHPGSHHNFHPLESNRSFSVVRCRLSVVVCIKSAHMARQFRHPLGDFRYGRRSSYDKLRAQAHRVLSSSI